VVQAHLALVAPLDEFFCKPPYIRGKTLILGVQSFLWTRVSLPLKTRILGPDWSPSSLWRGGFTAFIISIDSMKISTTMTSYPTWWRLFDLIFNGAHPDPMCLMNLPIMWVIHAT
jgi:hypothetical protein